MYNIKMYYKKQDIYNSKARKTPIIINDYIRCYVECLETHLLDDNIIFTVDVINTKEEKSEYKVFYSVTGFNDFVKWQRWLND